MKIEDITSEKARSLIGKEILYQTKTFLGTNYADEICYELSKIGVSAIRRVSPSGLYIELNGGKPEHNDIGWIKIGDFHLVEVL